MESVTLNHHIAWCGALGCRRIAIIFESEDPYAVGRAGVDVESAGGQTHAANAVMVAGDIRVMPHQKIKSGQRIFCLPAKAMAGTTHPLGTQSEVDSLSGAVAQPGFHFGGVRALGADPSKPRAGP